MSEQQMPARIWCDEIDADMCREKTRRANTAYFRSDIAERMAEALENLTANIEHAFPSWTSLGPILEARSALSAFKDSAQDRGAS